MSKMTTGSWIILFVFSGIADIVQFLFIEPLVFLFGAGVWINGVLDPVIGSIIGGFLWYKGVPLASRPRRIIALVGTEAMAALSGGFFQLWVFAVWYIFDDVRKSEMILATAAKEGDATAIALNAAFNQNGRREPEAAREGSRQDRAIPAVVDGVRRHG